MSFRITTVYKGSIFLEDGSTELKRGQSRIVPEVTPYYAKLRNAGKIKIEKVVKQIHLETFTDLEKRVYLLKRSMDKDLKIQFV